MGSSAAARRAGMAAARTATAMRTKSEASFACGLFRAAALLDECCGALSDVLADLFGQIVFGVLAKNAIAEPVHR